MKPELTAAAVFAFLAGACFAFALAGAIYGNGEFAASLVLVGMLMVLCTYCRVVEANNVAMSLAGAVNTLTDDVKESKQEFSDLESEYIRHVGGYEADDPKPKWCGTPRFSSN